MAIGVDVPNSFDGGGELLSVRFLKEYVLFAKGGKGAGEIGVFDTVMV